MDGILEQILTELKEIKQILKANEGLYTETNHDITYHDTMKAKEAAEYLGITADRLRTLSKQGKIKHLKSGNRFLYKRLTLDTWLKETLEASIQKNEEKVGYGRIRKIDIWLLETITESTRMHLTAL